MYRKNPYLLMVFPRKNPSSGFVRTQLIGLLAGIGIASIALFGRNTVFTVMDFMQDLRKDGYATTTDARVTSSEISINTKMIPLPHTFWHDPKFTVPPPDLFDSSEIPSTYETLPGPDPSPSPFAASTPPPAPAPVLEPTPSFDSKKLRESIHTHLASVFTGDLPYLLLKSGDRLYPGSRLTGNVTLEAITPTGIFCATPHGILKIEPQPASADQPLENENSEKNLPLDPPKPEPESMQPASDSLEDIVM